MRPILRKVINHIPLDATEYQQLLEYVERLREQGEESYHVFRANYGASLARDYALYLSRFSAGRAEMIQYLAGNPGVVKALRHGPLPVNEFPARFRDYLQAEYGEYLEAKQVGDILDWLDRQMVFAAGLPRKREGEAVLVYETGNPHKEWGLEYHFERIARHPFVTRIVSVRYLSRNKARADRFEVRGDDRLAGIFTNREKSIFYLVYLTEADSRKAENACKLLNLVFYDRY